MKPAKARVLVTGANGFIGKTLCRELRDSGYWVREAIRKSDDAHSDVIAVGDIGRDTDWSGALERIQVVIHLAARAHILDNKTADPLAAFRAVNVEGTKQLAQQAAQSGIQRFIFVSSIGVLGSSTQVGEPFTTHSVPAPRSHYAIAKWEAEQALQQVRSETGFEIVIVRPPLVHGAGAPGNMRRLLKWVYRGVPLPLASTGNRRSLIGVDNLADFLIHCVVSPAAANQTFIVSDEQDLSTTELIRLLANAMNRPARLFPAPEAPIRLLAQIIGKENIVDQLWGSLVIDSSKAYKDLKWSPPFTAAEGIEKMAQAYLEGVEK